LGKVRFVSKEPFVFYAGIGDSDPFLPFDAAVIHPALAPVSDRPGLNIR